MAGIPGSALLLARAGVAWPAASAMIAADQLVDVVFFCIALPIVFVTWTGSIDVPVDAVGLSDVLPWLVVPAVLRAVAVVVLHRWLQRQRWYSARVLQWRRFAREVLARLVQIACAHPAVFAGAILATAVQWSARYAILGVVLLGVGHPLPAAELVVLQAALAHLGQWTGAPAGVGVIEVGAGLALGQSMSATTASTVVLVWRLVTLHVPAIIGGLVFLRMTRAPGRAPRRTLP